MGIMDILRVDISEGKTRSFYSVENRDISPNSKTVAVNGNAERQRIIYTRNRQGYSEMTTIDRIRVSSVLPALYHGGFNSFQECYLNIGGIHCHTGLDLQ